MAQTSSETTTGQNRPYVLLSIGSHALLLPQSEVCTLASVQDIRLGDQGAHGVVGWLAFAGRPWPVYCLDEALHPLPHIPPGQRICALVRLNQGYFGLVCAHVTMLQGAAVHIRPVPAAMATPDSPLRGLIWQANSVGLVSTAAALGALLGVSEAVAPTVRPRC